MDIQFFAKNINEPAVICEAIIKEHVPLFDQKVYDEYETENHKIKCDQHYPDKWVKKPSDILGPDEKPVYQNVLERITRVPLAYQKQIVSTAVAFLTNGGITLNMGKTDAKGEKIGQAVKETWENNKLDYKNAGIAETAMSQLECAEIWYSDPITGDDGNRVGGEMKVRIYRPSDGYKFIPIWGEDLDMIAFGLLFETREKIECLDVYTKDAIRYFSKSGGAWGVRKDTKKLIYGKIPVIFWPREQTEWHDVQDLIERQEKVMSIYGDNNDYTGNPILFGKTDDTIDMPAKGETGKYLEGNGTSDLKFVERNGKPEPIIFEKDFLKETIFAITATPNLSFEEMKNLGEVSGAALERMLISAHMKAMRGHNGWYGEGIQRRLNFLISAISSMPGYGGAESVRIKPAFNLFKLDSDDDRITIAQKANGGLPVMTHKESIAYTRISDDPEITYTQIQKQIKAESAQPANIGE